MKKKICKKYGWILIWGLVSIVFAAVLQFLFSLEAPIPFLQAKWSAGDILTYSSTILLGLLALWQNQRFKNENDATQEKLEALSTRANELQITSKLIEHEAERINLLSEDGVIFISLDDGEIDNLKKISDEVLGSQNYVGTVIWERAFAPKNDAKYFSTSHDFVLVYAKNIEDFEIGKLPRTQEANARYKNPDNDPRGPWAADNMTVKTYSAAYDYPITTPNGTVVNPTNGRCWFTSKERMQKLIEDGRVYFGADGGNTPRLKRYLADVQQGMTPTTIWKCDDVGHNQEGRQELKKLFDDKGYFDSPKPQRLMHRILKVANLLDNSIVLDFFSGSASTAHAVMQLNAEDGGHRKFIMVQLPEKCDEKSEAYKAGYKNICEIGKERIRRAGAKIKEEAGLAAQNLDTGFRVLKCDTSNMKDVYYNPAEYEVNMFSRLEDIYT